MVNPDIEAAHAAQRAASRSARLGGGTTNARSSFEFHRSPSIPIDTTTPFEMRSKFTSNVYEFATANGGETSIAVPVGTPESTQNWLRREIDTTVDHKAQDRLRAISNVLKNPEEVRALMVNTVAKERANEAMDANLTLGAIQSLYNYGSVLESKFPAMSEEEKGKALKSRLSTEITSYGVRLTEIPAEKVWAGYNAYAGFVDASEED